MPLDHQTQVLGMLPGGAEQGGHLEILNPGDLVNAAQGFVVQDAEDCCS
jgi:hypothetical protein